MPFIYAVLVLGGLGFIFGGVLAFASTQFKVEVDPLIEQVQLLLPGANCGGCGYPGCAGLACAIVEKNLSLNTCPVMTPENRAKMATILGRDSSEMVAKVALVRCSGLPGEEYEKFNYQGIPGCQAAILISGGPKLCPHRCVGLGSCAKACPFNAIEMGDNDLPIISKEKCVACGKCVETCPKALITLTRQDREVHVKCNSPEKGAEVRKVCKVGCIGCGLCKKVCAYDAIIIENSLARIDTEKCVQCGACVSKCPQKTIHFAGKPEKKSQKAKIDQEACIGCTICFKVCKFEAVEGGTPKQKHSIISAKCVGCGLCATKCPKKCIKMEEV
ncbi:MAG: RnfABCDGE type electron transport complex subunit B [Candidatus Riflebacteria bacterium]|nr:RnfABCDGE type electron transport complex subunit B [Candidatus Riflebacteria bacterium]